MDFSLQTQQKGETNQAYEAYILRRDNPDVTLGQFYEAVYTGRAALSTMEKWSARFKWGERIADYKRPVTEKVAETVTKNRTKFAQKVSHDIIHGLLRIHQIASEGIEGNNEDITVRAAARLMHDNLHHLEKVFDIDFEGIKAEVKGAQTGSVIGQIYDIIEHKLPDNKDERLVIPIRPELKTTQSPTVISALACLEGEILFSGPVNCSKTIYALLYLIALHCAIPGFQSLILRSEAKTIYSSILPQLFNKILLLSPKDARQPFTLYGGDKRPLEIHWDNGGTTYFGGLDQAEKIRGAEFDLIFHSQLERERSEVAYSELIGRVEGGRGGNWFLRDGTPYNQIIGDANPGSPDHWLKSREELEIIKFFNFEHNDNPALHYNFVDTPQGKITKEGLNKRYHGYMLQRMVLGIWAGASGLVYPMFNKKIHVRPVDREEIKKDWKWFVSNDYGGQKPFVYQLWAVSPERNKFIMYREIYHTGWSLDKQVEVLKGKLTPDVKPRTMFAEHDFPHNRKFEDEKISVTLAHKKDKLLSIELCKEWLATPGAIVFNENALVHPVDPELEGQPQRTVEEFRSYAYKEEGTVVSSHNDEDPVKAFDHGMDAFRYMLASLRKINYIPDFSGVSYSYKEEPTHVF